MDQFEEDEPPYSLNDVHLHHGSSTSSPNTATLRVSNFVLATPHTVASPVEAYMSGTKPTIFSHKFSGTTSVIPARCTYAKQQQMSRECDLSTKCKSTQCDLLTITESRDTTVPEPVLQVPAMLLQLNKLREAGDFCDAKIVLGARLWMCHQCVLAANCSSLYNSMKVVDTAPGNVLAIELAENILPCAVEIMLRMFYTGKLDIKQNNAQELLRLAYYLKMPFAEDKCKEFMKDNGMLINITKLEVDGYTPLKIISPAVGSLSSALMEGVGQENAVSRTDEVGYASESDVKTELSGAQTGKVHHRKTKKFSCSFCWKSFPRKADAVIHERRKHTKIKPFSCPKCEQAFVLNRQLKLHIQLHANRDLLKCDKCDKRLTTVEGLKQHMKKMHVDRLYACTNIGCDQSFPSDADLTKHSGSCPHASSPSTRQCYQCEACGKSFKSRHHLHRHAAAVHLKLKPFHCDQCERAFSRKEMLKQHQATHTGLRKYACDICNKRFKQSASLYSHKQIHAENREIMCDLCGHSCFSRSALRRHQQTHSLEKPYQCARCPKSFKTQQYLKRHEAIHDRSGLTGRKGKARCAAVSSDNVKTDESLIK